MGYVFFLVKYNYKLGVTTTKDSCTFYYESGVHCNYRSQQRDDLVVEFDGRVGKEAREQHTLQW